MDLTILSPGQKGQVSCVCEDGGRRLQDLGLIAGAEVRCLFQSPLGGPTAYQICGVTVALRKTDARKVLLERIWD